MEDEGRGGEAGSSLDRVCNDQQNSSAELEPSSFGARVELDDTEECRRRLVE